MATDLTPERRTEIETMLCDLTPGEWRWIDAYTLEAVDRQPDAIEREYSHWSDVAMNILSGARGFANRRFLAVAPTYVRELLAALDAKQAALDYAVSIIKSYEMDGHIHYGARAQIERIRKGEWTPA
jgi:hypothetical protein